MSDKVLSIYKIGREEAGLTQEQAAELLGVSPRQLARYESLETIPSCEVAADMIELYGAEWMGYMYLREHNEVGKMILPDITLQDAGLGTLRFFKEHGDIEEIKDEMITIVCDGVIDEYEMPIWRKRHRKEIFELASACLSLLFMKENKSKKKAHPAATERAS